MEQVESLEETVKKKLQAKYDVKLEGELKEWIVGKLGKPMDDSMSFQENLKSGVLLCELVNTISPGYIKKINTSALPFKQMENIVTFLKACSKLGFGDEKLFDTIDLFENKDPNKVLISLVHLRQRSEDFQKDPALLAQILAAETTKTPPSGGSLAAGGRQSSIGRALSPVPYNKPTSALSPEPVQKQSPQPDKSKATMVPSVQNLGADVALKEELKYNPELERMATHWICQVVGITVPNTSIAEFLKDGIYLCKLMNTIQPNSIPKIHTGNIAFQKIENIGNYIKACKKLGMELDLFDINDLFEEKNINYVINHVHVLAKHVAHLPTYTGPRMEQEDLSKTRNLFSANLTSNFVDFKSNEGAEEMTEEQQDLLAWLNGILMNCMPPHPSIHNLSSNLRSGKVIVKLLSELTHHSVGAVVEDPKTMWHCMENAASIIRFLASETCETVSMCSARDIASGNVDRISALLEYIRDKFDLEFVFANLLQGELDDSEVLEIMSQLEENAASIDTTIPSVVVDKPSEPSIPPTAESAPKPASPLASPDRAHAEIKEPVKKASPAGKQVAEESAQTTQSPRFARRSMAGISPASAPKKESPTRPASMYGAQPVQPSWVKSTTTTPPRPAEIAPSKPVTPPPEAEADKPAKMDVKSRLSMFEQASKPAAKPAPQPTKPTPVAETKATAVTTQVEPPKSIPEPVLKPTEVSPVKEITPSAPVELTPPKELTPTKPAYTEPVVAEPVSQPTPAHVEPTPVHPAQAEPTPAALPTPIEPSVEPTPVEPARVEPTPVDLTPTPTEPTTIEPAPVEPTPLPQVETPTPFVEPIPVEPTPTEPTPAPIPVQPTPPVEPATEPTPTEPVHEEPAHEQPTTEPSPVEVAPIPVEPTTESVPAVTPIEPTPAHEDRAPITTEPVPAPTETTAITTEPVPAEPTHVEPTPAEPTPTEPSHVEPTPVAPAEPTPTEPTPTPETTTEVVPSLTEPTPSEAIPAITEPSHTVPTPTEQEPTEAQPVSEPVPEKPAEPTIAEEPTAAAPSEPVKPEEPTQPTEPVQPTVPTEVIQVEPAIKVEEPVIAVPSEPVPEPAQPEPTPTEASPTKPSDAVPAEASNEAAPLLEATVALASAPAPAQEADEGTRKVSFAVPDVEEKPQTIQTKDGVLIEVGPRKTISLSGIPTSPRAFANGRTLRRMKLQVDESGEYTLGKLSPKTVATATNSHKIAAAQFLMRKRIATEILTTERSYIKSLQTVMQLVETVKTSKSLNEREFYTVFANLPEVLQYHINFVKIIEYSIADTWRDMTVVSEIFEQFEFAEIYSKYILNYNKCCVTLHQLKRRNQPFQKDVEEFEMLMRKNSGLHNLDAYLVMPVQRVPRYLLLLRDLHKYSPNTHPDHFLLPGTVDRIQKKLDEINASITPGELEEIRKIVMIDESIDNMAETLFRPNRKYIREGHLVLKLKGHSVNFRSSMSVKPGSLSLSFFKKKSHHAAPMWFLFTDVLIYCEKKQSPDCGKLFDYITSLNIADISEVREKVAVDTKKKSKKGYSKLYGFGIVVDSVDWVLYASNEDEKKAWVNDLLIMLMQHKKRLIQEGHRSMSVNGIPSRP